MKYFSFLLMAVVVSLAASGMAFGQVDTTGIQTELTNAGTAIGTIGAAMLTVAGAGIAFRWILGFLFG